MIYFKSPCGQYNLVTGLNKNGYFMKVISHAGLDIPINEKIIIETNTKQGVVVNRSGLPIKKGNHLAGVNLIIKFLKNQGTQLNNLVRIDM